MACGVAAGFAVNRLECADADHVGGLELDPVGGQSAQLTGKIIEGGLFAPVDRGRELVPVLGSGEDTVDHDVLVD